MFALVAWLLMACQAPTPTGTTVSAAGLRFVAPPGWAARLDPPPTTGGTALLGWATNQVPSPACAGACAHPISALAPDGIIVLVRRIDCLPNCQLPDAGRTLIGGREAVRQEIDGQVCEALAGPGASPVSAEAIVASVTPQRQDVFLVCAAAHATRLELDRLIASVGWTIP